jgi:hypothetical protein
MKAPKLKKIKGPWLSDSHQYDKRLSESKKYLVYCKGYGWKIGTFSKVWFGWVFYDGFIDHQFSYGKGITIKAIYEMSSK